MEDLKKFDRRAFCEDRGCSTLIFLDVKYDDAIIGVSTNNNVVYNGMYMVELMTNHDSALSWVDAMDHYNDILLPSVCSSNDKNMYPLIIDLN